MARLAMLEGLECAKSVPRVCQECVKSMIDSEDLFVLIKLKAESKEEAFSGNRGRVIYSIVKKLISCVFCLGVKLK